MKKAELISVARGTGGTEIVKDLKDISLLDVYQAVDCLGKTGQLFSFHDNPNPNCPVGAHIHDILDHKLERIQQAMEAEAWSDKFRTSCGRCRESDEGVNSSLKQEKLMRRFLYSMKIKKQTRKLAAGCSKHSFEVADKADVV